jgi:hypothetical protein
MVNVKEILAQVHKQREQLSSELVGLDRAIEALIGISGAAQAGRGKRHISAAARARIAAAQRTRWAKWKRQRKRNVR